VAGWEYTPDAMWKAEIKAETEYALREKRSSGAPCSTSASCSHVRGKKSKAEGIEPNPGLVDYVESQNSIGSKLVPTCAELTRGVSIAATHQPSESCALASSWVPVRWSRGSLL
jgi:hypothetical protein